MSPAQSDLLEMSQIRKSFFGQEVLHGVDLSLKAGEVRGLVGHNGAGKSTLIKILAGVHTDYSGQIMLDGTPIELRDPADAKARGIGVIHQEFALVPGFDVAQNLALGSEPKIAPGFVGHRAIQKEAQKLLDRVNFTLPQRVPVGRLSVAHQQLTEIAKALALNARVLVMDEPTSRLAPAERQALFNVIRDLSESGVGIIYISHFLEEVLEVCDNLTVLRDGNVVDERPSSEHTLDSLTEQIIGTQIAEHAEEARQESSDVETDARTVLSLQGFGPQGHPGVDLEAQAGQVIGLAGLVGSGRTELLEAIMGARKSHGVREINGERPRIRDTFAAIRNGIAMVPEDRKSRGLIMERGIVENIALSALQSQFSRGGLVMHDKRDEAASDAMARFRILFRNAEAPVRTLSGGNQQKVLLARSATVKPIVLLLDQPTAGVDIGAKREIYEHVERFVKDGATCIVASDELEELLTMCDQIAVVRAGRITSIRPAAEYDERSLLAEMSKTDKADIGVDIEAVEGAA